MKKVRTMALFLLSLTCSLFLTGCWNYREIDKMAIVAGVAVDKGSDGQLKVTAEIIASSGGRESKTESKIVTMEGKTVFDAVRNGIAITGKRLYWSHSIVLILSKDIGAEGIRKLLDWYIRDAECREDVNLLISVGQTAGEILSNEGTTEEIKSISLGETIKNQVSLSKAPKVDVLNFELESKNEGIATILPTVKLVEVNKKMVPQIIGSAIIKADKIEGYLSGEETKALLFIRDEVNGGLLIDTPEQSSVAIPVSLEIFTNKTKVKPKVSGKDIKFDINVETTVAIDELHGSVNYIDEAGRKKLEIIAAKALKSELEFVINKLQADYGADIFGFGTKLRENKIKVWNRVNKNWEQIFSDMKVNVDTKVHIKNSGILAREYEKGS
ncbi:MAG: germination protein Ger(X)C family [Eubacterium sp.]|jgi:spore germination protein KC|nr:germination protein Ger(X)C family [Eubacterium sp.]